MKGGYVKIFRSLADHDLWKDEKFTRGQAWVDLLLLANWKPGSFRVRGVLIELKRGQVAASEAFLADRWGWSRGKVRRFLNELENRQQIVQQKSRLITVITVLNYDHHQSNGTSNSTTDGTTNGHTKERTKHLRTPLTPQGGVGAGLNSLEEWSKIRRAVECMTAVDRPGLEAVKESMHPESLRVAELIGWKQLESDLSEGGTAARVSQSKFEKHLTNGNGKH